MAEPTNPQSVWMDGKLVAWDAATIHITQIGTAGVSSVFEGIRAYWNAEKKQLYIFRLAAHLDRFAQSMRLMRMAQPFSRAELEQAVGALVRANGHAEDTYIRPVAFAESGMFGSAGVDKARVVVNTTGWGSRLQSGKVNHACFSSWNRIGDNVMPPRVKASSNYLNSRLASEEARRNGYDNALLLNTNGKVAEAPGACLMLVREGKLITPSVTSGILESITRATLVQICREWLGLEVVEREVDRTELYVAAEAFLCGTGAEIAPIVSVDRLPVGNGERGPLTTRIESVYHDLVRGIDTRGSEWRTEV